MISGMGLAEMFFSKDGRAFHTGRVMVICFFLSGGSGNRVHHRAYGKLGSRRMEYQIALSSISFFSSATELNIYLARKFILE